MARTEHHITETTARKVDLGDGPICFRRDRPSAAPGNTLRGVAAI